MCYQLRWDNRQHKAGRAESKFCFPFFIIFLSKKNSAPSYLAKKQFLQRMR